MGTFPPSTKCSKKNFDDYFRNYYNGQLSYTCEQSIPVVNPDLELRWEGRGGGGFYLLALLASPAISSFFFYPKQPTVYCDVSVLTSMDYIVDQKTRQQPGVSQIPLSPWKCLSYLFLLQNVTQKMRSNPEILFVVVSVDIGSCIRNEQREVSLCKQISHYIVITN